MVILKLDMNQSESMFNENEKYLLICFKATSNEARLWLIKQYELYLENPQAFTLLCVDTWQGTQEAYRADIGADLRDKLSDRLLDEFLQNIFYCSSNCSNIEDGTQELQAIIQQLKQQRNLLN
jgi:hypothetical protein